jgi:thiamine monophosphate synthase
MSQKKIFEIKKFQINNKKLPICFLFTDRKKINDIQSVINNLPERSAIIVREYDLSKTQREYFAKEIIEIVKKKSPKKSPKIIIGKDFLLAKKLKADGVHFSDFDHIPFKLKRGNNLPKNFIFTFSCHSLKSINLSQKIPANIFFISPVFSTKNYQEKDMIGLKRLAKINYNFYCRKNKKERNFRAKLYALGGVKDTNLISLRKIGLNGFGAINTFLNYEKN